MPRDTKRNRYARVLQDAKSGPAELHVSGLNDEQRKAINEHFRRWLDSWIVAPLESLQDELLPPSPAMKAFRARQEANRGLADQTYQDVSAGLAAAAAGLGSDANPHPAGTKRHASWYEGWHPGPGNNGKAAK